MQDVKLECTIYSTRFKKYTPYIDFIWKGETFESN